MMDRRGMADAIAPIHQRRLRGHYQGPHRAADIAIQQARLGIAQSEYPLLSFPDPLEV